MIDSHYHPENWGVKPILFHIGQYEIPSYSFFILLALMAGCIIYIREAKKVKKINENGLFIAVGSIIGGVLGAKILYWVMNYKLIISNIGNINYILPGRTIIGGLIGGTIGVLITKKILKTKEKNGNLFAPAIALGVAIGRIGCFLAGCCYGGATTLPWGVNFGDGILRHPTQIYESIFMLIMFLYLQKIKNRENIKPGYLFKLLMIYYFTFRFFIEFIRVEKIAFLGLTIFQIICIGVIIYLTRNNIFKLINRIWNKQKQIIK